MGQNVGDGVASMARTDEVMDAMSKARRDSAVPTAVRAMKDGNAVEAVSVSVGVGVDKGLVYNSVLMLIAVGVLIGMITLISVMCSKGEKKVVQGGAYGSL